MGSSFTTLEDMQAAGLITEDQLTSGLRDSLPPDKKLSWGIFQALGARPPINASSKRWAAVIEIDGRGRIDRAWFSRPGGVGNYQASRMSCPVDLLKDVHAVEIGADEAKSHGSREVHRTYWVTVPVTGYDDGDPVQVAWLLCPTAQYAWGLRNALRLDGQPLEVMSASPVEAAVPVVESEPLATADPVSDSDLLGMLVSCEQSILDQDWHAAHYLAQQLACELLGRKVHQKRAREEHQKQVEAKVDQALENLK